MTISFSGLASGLDTSSWVTSLTQLRQAKVTKLEEQKSDILTARSTLQGIKSFFSSFRASLEKITDSKFKVSSMDIFSKKIATVSNSAVLSATAKSNAAEGSYEVKVNNTATQTQVKSGYRYKTMLVSTTQATTSSVLKNIGIGYGTNPETGITSGTIEINHDGVKSSIYVSTNETMDSFLGKLHEVGIEADFDNDTGIFSIGVSAEDINDIGNTNVLNKLKINSINYGYTGNQLKIEETHEEYHQATEETLLSELGVHTGTITITTAHGVYEVTLDNDDTIGSLVSALNEEGIEATFNNGVFSITNANINSDGTTNLIQAFGLTDPSVATQTQQSDGLTYQTVYTSTTTANLGTKLKDLDGVELNGNQTIVVQNADGVTSTLTVGTTTTIGGMINQMNAGGVNLGASFNEYTGVLSINNGWIIDGGTFDVETAFGLQYTGVAAMVTGDQLTVTTTTITGATGATKLKDLTTAVTNGTIKVTDTTGTAHNVVINANNTIDEFTATIRDLGLGASFNDLTGMLTLVGGSYTTEGISDANKSNILSVFFGTDTLTPSAVDSATSTSTALRVATVSTYAATGTTTLGELNMTAGNYTASFRVDGSTREVSINQNMSLNDLVTAMENAGIDADFNSDTHKLMITDGEYIGVSGGNFGTIMNFTSTITGRYVTSNSIMAQSVTSPQEVTSGTVYYTTDVVSTSSSTVTTTVATVQTSGVITYESIQTTTTGSTQGVIATGDSISYTTVHTTGTSQTTGTLTYNVTTPGGTTTSTAGQSTSSGLIMVGDTVATTQTSGTLTYEVTTPGSTINVTTGTSVSSDQITLDITTGIQVTSADPITYVENSGGSVTVGIEATFTSTLEYETTVTTTTGGSTAGVTTTIVSSALTYTTTVNATQTTYAIGQTGDSLQFISGYTNTALAMQSGSTITTTAGKSVTSGAIIGAVTGDSYFGQIKITIKNNATQATVTIITLTTTQTMGDLCNALTQNGFNTSLTNGRISIGTNNSKYIHSITGCSYSGTDSWLKIGVGEGYSYEHTSTAYRSATEDDMLCDLYINNSGNGGGQIHYTLTTMDNTVYDFWVTDPDILNHNAATLGNVIDKLQELGYSAGIDNSGHVWFSPEQGMNSNNIIKTMDANLLAAIGMSGKVGNGQTYTVGYSGTTVQSVGGKVIDVILNTDDTQINIGYDLNYLGLDDKIYIKKTDGSTFTLLKTDSLRDALVKFINNGFCVKTGNSWITSVNDLPSNGTMVNASAIKIGQYNSSTSAAIDSVWNEDAGAVDSGVFLDVTDIGYGRTYSYTSQSTQAYYASTSTKLSSLGVTGTGYITTSAGTITVTDNQTLNDLINNLKDKLGSSKVSYNSTTGKLTVKTDSSHYITGVSDTSGGNLRSWFSTHGLGAFNSGATYSVTSGSTTTTTTMTAASNSTQMSELGLTSTQTFTVDNNETYTVYTTTTVAQLKDMFNTAGLQTIYETSNGHFTIKQILYMPDDRGVGEVGEGDPREGGGEIHYLSGMSTDLANLLNVTIGDGYTHTMEEGGTAAAAIADEYTTFGQLGFGNNEEGYITLSNGATATFDADSTIGDLCDFMYNNGTSAYLDSGGSFFVGHNSIATQVKPVITAMSDNLRAALNLNPSSTHPAQGYFYSVETGVTATAATTFAQLGITDNITITTDHTSFVYNAHSGEGDIGDFIICINNSGNDISASFSNGVLTLSPGSTHYITSISPNFTSHIPIQIGENHTYTVNNSTTEPTTTETVATLQTTLGQLGFTGTGYITLNTGATMECTGTTSIENISDFLSNNMIRLYLNSSGVLELGRPAHPEDNYILSMSESLSDVLGISPNYTLVGTTASADATLAELGMSGTHGYITTDTGTLSFEAGDSIQDIIDTLNSNSVGMYASLSGGQLSIEPQNGHYVIGMSGNLRTALGGIAVGNGHSYTETTNTSQGSTTSHIVNGDTTLGMMGLDQNQEGSITLNNGTVLTFDSDTTISELMGALNGANVHAGISNGNITIGSTSDANYIVDISSNLEYILNVDDGEGKTYISGNTVINATTSTSLEELGLTGIKYITTNTGTITVYVDGGDNIQDVLDALNANNYFTATFSNSTHSMTIKPSAGHWIEGMSPSLAQALGFEDTIFKQVNDEVTQTNTVTATSLTSLNKLNPNFSNGVIVTNVGNINISGSDSISGVISYLSDKGITASYDQSTGIFTLGSTSNTNYVLAMSEPLSQALGNISTGRYFTYNVIEEEQGESITTPTAFTVTTANSFGDLGITSGGTINFSNGSTLAVTSETNIGTFITNMSGYGFNVSLNNGVFNISPTGDNAILGCDGENILSAMNISQTPYTVSNGLLANTELKDLRDNNGFNLGIESGLIRVYKNGVASNIWIDNESTIDSLAEQLRFYNIQVTCSNGSNGKIIFSSSGDSYLSEIAGGSNLLSAMGISTWTIFKNTSSQALNYEVGSDEVITSDTKLVDLKNADGSSAGITTGKYKITAAGINYEGTIDATTSVGDLFAQLSYYGFTGSINSNGQITLSTANDDTYLVRSNGAAGYSNLVDTLFQSWTFGNIYNSNSMDVTTSSTVNMTSETRLKDIDQGTYKAGKVVISSSLNGDTTINLAENATVGDFMAALSYHGFNSYIENGRLIVQNDGYTTLKNYSVPSEASNVLSLLGLNTSAWEQPGFYTGTTQTTTNHSTVLEAATRDTKLSDLRYANGTELGITTGEYWIYTNGVKHAVNLTSTDITLDNFMNMLSGYGITTTLNTENNQSILKIVGSGDSYVATSNAAGASNVVQKLFGSGKGTLYDYSGYQQTTELVSTTVIAGLGTYVSDYDHGNVKSEGTFALTVDGNYSEINITSYDTFGSLIDKFERAGVHATLTDGVFRLETGNKTFVVDAEHTTSNLISNLGLYYSNNLGGFAASSEAVTQTTTTIEDRTLSVAKYADMGTQLGLLNISSGSLSVYKNGAKQLITIDNTETFSQLRSRVNDAFSGSVTIDFVDGKLRFYSTVEGVDVQVGSSNDTSNISSICGFSQDENGYIVSARELYKVNASSLITTPDLFRYGNVTEGTFVIGDETFTITNDTTIQNIVAQINSSEKANASAYWDSVDGKLVISSRSTGASMVNIEAGTSNFTDILGLTASEWNGDGSVSVTRILLESQELGNNAKFTINGTSFQSASNVITSDVSRIQGLTLNLKGSSMGDTITVSITKDAEAVTEAVGEFVDAYNELVDNVDTELASTGVLKDQSTLKFIRQQIRNLLVNTFAGATTFRNLAALGISTSAGNTVSSGDVSGAGIEYLYFDSEKFLEGYNKDADAVKNMLVGSDETPGILLQIENIVTNALSTGTGYFSIADKSYSDKITSINEKIRKANEAIEAYRARLESKFKSMDLLISQMQNQYNSFLGGTTAA